MWVSSIKTTERLATGAKTKTAWLDKRHSPNLGPRFVTPAEAGALLFFEVASTLLVAARVSTCCKAIQKRVKHRSENSEQRVPPVV